MEGAVIPEFNKVGTLPQGFHVGTWDEIVEAFGGNRVREDLLRGLRRMLERLGSAGCSLVYIDGSFVTNIELPGDFDIAYDLDSVDFDKLDPIFFDHKPPRAAQKALFGGEALPNVTAADGSVFVEFFLQDKLHPGSLKGIVTIDPRTLL